MMKIVVLHTTMPFCKDVHKYDQLMEQIYKLKNNGIQFNCSIRIHISLYLICE